MKHAGVLLLRESLQSKIGLHLCIGRQGIIGIRLIKLGNESRFIVGHCHVQLSGLPGRHNAIIALAQHTEGAIGRQRVGNHRQSTRFEGRGVGGVEGADFIIGKIGDVRHQNAPLSGNAHKAVLLQRLTIDKHRALGIDVGHIARRRILALGRHSERGQLRQSYAALALPIDRPGRRQYMGGRRRSILGHREGSEHLVPSAAEAIFLRHFGSA